ncbi:hypothetical protein ALO_12406 [Acetonema longum DSM 6540]|uniref:Uncharacterized protein n=1 Tax=Acetonema longum DSM 6540 TaxID=1009370 RepID=F7NK68_9FIRM|nr:hypothetical protein ALO_12406 [Acetonema longum DSM 6540]
MERTIIDWMFEHPWLTTFILWAFAAALGRRSSA